MPAAVNIWEVTGTSPTGWSGGNPGFGDLARTSDGKVWMCINASNDRDAAGWQEIGGTSGLNVGGGMVEIWHMSHGSAFGRDNDPLPAYINFGGVVGVFGAFTSVEDRYTYKNTTGSPILISNMVAKTLKQSGSPQFPDKDLIITVRKNKADTDLKITVPYNNTTGQYYFLKNDTDSFLLQDGDLISMKFDWDGGTPTTGGNVGVYYVTVKATYQ